MLDGARAKMGERGRAVTPAHLQPVPAYRVRRTDAFPKRPRTIYRAQRRFSADSQRCRASGGFATWSLRWWAVHSLCMQHEMKNPELAAIIKEFRAKRALTQEHLAQLSEVNIRTIQRLESSGACSKDNLRAVAEAFDTDVKQLIEEAEARKALNSYVLQFFEEIASTSVLVNLQEMTGPKELLDGLAGCVGQITDFPEDLSDSEAGLVGAALDFLKDFAEIESGLNPSEKIKMAAELNQNFTELKQAGISPFLGLVTGPSQANEQSEATVAVIRFLRMDAKGILNMPDGARVSPVLIPKRNLHSC
jgi:transcriptional regulator with XRE-family HTH domain